MKKGKPTDKLTARQREFLRQYLLSRNASEAYRVAYKYKGKNADVLSAKVLVTAGIQAEIQKAEAKRQEEFEISEKRIIQELAAVAFGHAGRVLEWNEDSVELIAKKDLDETDMKFIDSISETAGEFGNSIKMTTLAGQKVKALELLGKHVGMWKEGGGGGEDRTKQVVGRLAEYFKKRKPTSGV